MLTEGKCSHCFYYGQHDATWFWSREKDYLFPYNIGKRLMEYMNWDRRPLSDPKVNWRDYLKTQPGYGH